MEFGRIQNAIELFGQASPPPPPQAPPPDRLFAIEPKLEIAWGSFHGGIWSNFAALFGPRAAAGWLAASIFRDSWVEGRIPKRAVLAAALWHAAILALPFSFLTGISHRNVALQNVEVSWQGPITDLPLLDIARERHPERPAEKPRALAKAKPEEPAPAPAPPLLDPIEAFHPRQRIYTDPARPTHPQQTLINPAAPLEAPKLLPNLPNLVQFQQAGPARPRLQISEEMLKKLRPKEKRAATSPAAAPADMPNMEQHVSELSLPAAQSAPARPKLELNPSAAPRLATKTQTGDASPAPEVAATDLTAPNGGANALIALSATPAPPAPAQPPPGNLAARIAVSPEGKPPEGKPAGGKPNPPVPAGNPSGASGKGDVAVSISGGNPPADASRAGNAKIAAPAQRVVVTRPEPKFESEDAAERTSPPDFAALPPGAKPEAIFAAKRVYSLNVNMPNLNSATGSWILNFSELRADADRRRASPNDLSGPVPLKKVDPKYPPTLVSERVQGEVVLYAVIRRDGSVDSIQLVRGVDEQLDANAIKALSQWQFRPAAKQGVPVELEAIVHIPFRLPEYQ